MRILAIGDFHGSLDKKFKKIIEKEKIDLVISLGDYPPFHYRNLWFKHCYGKDVELSDVIGKSKYKKLVLEDLRRAEKALKKINNLPVPVYTTLGNVDYPNLDDVIDTYSEDKKRMPNYINRGASLIKRMKKHKNISRFDYKAKRFGKYIFIGMRGHSFPGDTKSKAFKKHKQKLERLFKKYKKENKEGRVIFVSHNIAHNTKLDKLSLKAVKFALKNAGEKKKKIKKRKKHYGSKLARRIINQQKPILHIGGHVHESSGKDKIRRTTLVNPGAAHEGKAAIIELGDGKLKKIKFVK